MSLGFFLTRMPFCSIKDKCQEAYCRAAKGPRPLEGSLCTDGAGDRANARLARSRTPADRALSIVARSDRQVSARLGLASTVHEGSRRVFGRPCAKHGARALSPDRLHMLREGIPQGSQRAGSERAAGPVIAAGGDDNRRYKPMRNINATIARNIDDVCSGVFEPTT
jgi:hypothetical protein